jgi:hypothetical protein
MLHCDVSSQAQLATKTRPFDTINQTIELPAVVAKDNVDPIIDLIKE